MSWMLPKVISRKEAERHVKFEPEFDVSHELKHFLREFVDSDDYCGLGNDSKVIEGLPGCGMKRGYDGSESCHFLLTISIAKGSFWVNN